jgi:hypothetical protein
MKPQQVAHLVAPQPVPSMVNVGLQPMSDGTRSVTLQVDDVTGRKITFFNPDDAEKIGQALIDTARQCKTGLQVVQRLVDPNGKPVT